MTPFTTSPTLHGVPWTLFCRGTDAFFFWTPPLSSSGGGLQSVIRQCPDVNWDGDAIVCLDERMSCTLSDEEPFWMNFDRECSGAHMSARNSVFTEEPTRARPSFKINHSELSWVCQTLNFKKRVCVTKDSEFLRLFETLRELL